MKPRGTTRRFKSAIATLALAILPALSVSAPAAAQDGVSDGWRNTCQADATAKSCLRNSSRTSAFYITAQLNGQTCYFTVPAVSQRANVISCQVIAPEDLGLRQQFSFEDTPYSNRPPYNIVSISSRYDAYLRATRPDLLGEATGLVRVSQIGRFGNPETDGISLTLAPMKEDINYRWSAFGAQVFRADQLSVEFVAMDCDRNVQDACIDVALRPYHPKGDPRLSLSIPGGQNSPQVVSVERAYSNQAQRRFELQWLEHSIPSLNLKSSGAEAYFTRAPKNNDPTSRLTFAAESGFRAILTEGLDAPIKTAPPRAFPDELGTPGRSTLPPEPLGLTARDGAETLHFADQDGTARQIFSFAPAMQDGRRVTLLNDDGDWRLVTPDGREMPYLADARDDGSLYLRRLTDTGQLAGPMCRESVDEGAALVVCPDTQGTPFVLNWVRYPSNP